MAFYCYGPGGSSDFRPRAPKPDLKACLIWFIVFLIVVVAISVYAIWFEK